MYEKELEKAQERLNAAMSLAQKAPAEAVNMILDMEKWVDETFDNNSNEYYGVIITYNEAMGDINLKSLKFVEAEKYYKKMVATATKLYETDKTKFDLRLARSYCKLANNCATNIRCHEIRQTPLVLNEKTQRPFDAGENFYKVAIKVIEDSCKKGSAVHLETRGRAINSLASMEACVGHYKEALKMVADSVNIFKAIYQTIDNKNTSVLLAQTLAMQANIATLYKDFHLAQEALEDAIFALKEHEDEDAVRSGVFIARHYLNLASAMLLQGNQNQDEIDVMYDKSTEKISMVNTIAQGAAPYDEATCYMLSGTYYLKTDRAEKGEKQIRHADEILTELIKKYPQNQQFANSKKHIDTLLSEIK